MPETEQSKLSARFYPACLTDEPNTSCPMDWMSRRMLFKATLIAWARIRVLRIVGGRLKMKLEPGWVNICTCIFTVLQTF